MPAIETRRASVLRLAKSRCAAPPHDTHATHAVVTSSVEKLRGTPMAYDLAELKKAREALIRERRTRTATIVSTSGTIGDPALDAIIKVQDAIEAVDRAIDELDEAEEEYEEDVDD